MAKTRVRSRAAGSAPTPVRHTLVMFAVMCLAAVSACSSGPVQPAEFTTSRYIVQAPPQAVQCTEGAESRTWAVVIGINNYKSEGIPDLGGAVNDAWAFYHYLASPEGGATSPHRLRLLLNDQATRANVEGALGNFLQNACPQDQVIIFFAGHGSPEPDNEENAFLLMHDTELENMVGTGISMQQLPDFLSWRAGSAGRLLMLIDACHSGNIVFPGKRGVKNLNRSKAVVGNLENVTKGKEGWGAISAAGADQVAGEVKCELGGQPYQGGVFTCTIMDGLVGDADADNSGEITLDELFGHVKGEVSSATGNSQVPQLSGTLDDEMVVGRRPTRSVAIPRVPERYLIDGNPHPFRIWWQIGLAATAVSFGASMLYIFFANDVAIDTKEQVESPTGIDRETYASNMNERERNQALANVSASVGVGFFAASIGLFLLDLLLAPDDIGDVYDDDPWFELGVTPKGSAGTLDLNIAWD